MHLFLRAHSHQLQRRKHALALGQCWKKLPSANSPSVNGLCMYARNLKTCDHFKHLTMYMEAEKYLRTLAELGCLKQN